ncbi:MAG: DUF2723 domain-containing protein [Ignavibacteriales bacterium]|nr:DUF2723 domain-containing protein [Ignavibacteriales bacterium]
MNRVVAALVFIISIVVYAKTLSDTVVFWDVGEFIAAAILLQVPHPPGSPLFLLVTKIFTMVPFATDPAVRAHFVSALCSALASTFLYLSIVKLILLWKQKPADVADKLALYGAGLIGALSLTFSPTFWFNAVEAEVYGASMFFIGLITYLALRWNEQAEIEGNERYILFIAYLIGLSLGVHLLALLVIFPFLMIIYFRRYDFTIISFLKFGVVAVIIFGVVYPGIVKFLPNLLDGEVTIGGEVSKSIFWSLAPIAVIAAAIYGVFYSVEQKKKLLNIALLSGLLIVLGYSTYTMVIIRANEPLPMNENNPSNLSRLVSYLNREQYGDAPLVQRRYSDEPQHQIMFRKYTSDSDFLMRYQLDHMFTRYFLWQYAGIEGDWQDAGVRWSQLYGIPLLVGLFGLFWHFKRDRKMAFVFLAFFAIMGIVLALYFNMQEPQPRERDYFFVGAFFVFSIWIGIGVMGVIEAIWSILKKPALQSYAAGGVVLALVILVPGNMLRTNYKDADRTGDFLAWDYAYNLLQSCEPDAILFTNGDNDTFPLWYLQDVEGVRRDIRIVNLSLANIAWYVHQLKSLEPHGAKKVPISLSDVEIDGLRPMMWEPRQMTLDVPQHVIDAYAPLGVDTAIARTGKLSFLLPNTITSGKVKAIRMQDIVAWDIILTNRWERPVYFAVTASTDCKIGLEQYFRMDGLAAKMIPVKAVSEEGTVVDSILSANLYREPAVPSKTFQRGYRYRGLDNKSVTYDENALRMISNYRNAFLRLALYHLNYTHDNAKTIAALDSMETKMPRSVVPMESRLLYDVANFYNYAGAKEKFKKLSIELEGTLLRQIEQKPTEALTQRNPYTMLLMQYEARREYVKAIDILRKIDAVYGSQRGMEGLSQEVSSKITQLQTEIALQKSTTKDTATARE